MIPCVSAVFGTDKAALTMGQNWTTCLCMSALQLKKSLADAIRYKMAAEHLSISTFAKKTKTGRNSVRRILDGKNTAITLRTMAKAAKALNLRSTESYCEAIAVNQTGQDSRTIGCRRRCSQSRGAEKTVYGRLLREADPPARCQKYSGLTSRRVARPFVGPSVQKKHHAGGFNAGSPLDRNESDRAG